MTQDVELLGTGLPGLDRVLHGLIAGDNVIWQVESIDDYVPFVEADILYLALSPTLPDNVLNTALLGSLPNSLPDLLPSAEKWENVVRVVDTSRARPPRSLTLNANTLSQKVVCYFEAAGQ